MRTYLDVSSVEEGVERVGERGGLLSMSKISLIEKLNAESALKHESNSPLSMKEWKAMDQCSIRAHIQGYPPAWHKIHCGIMSPPVISHTSNPTSHPYHHPSSCYACHTSVGLALLPLSIIRFDIRTSTTIRRFQSDAMIRCMDPLQ
jgi:hypothetical protein